MDALKRNLFNVRNDLENVFRTTLHDLNISYQDQAFDAMVEEATTWVFLRYCTVGCCTWTYFEAHMHTLELQHSGASICAMFLSKTINSLEQ